MLTKSYTARTQTMESQSNLNQIVNIFCSYLFLQSILPLLNCQDRYSQQITHQQQKNLPSGNGFKAFGLIKSLGTKGVLELSIFSLNLSCGRVMFLA